MPAINFIECFGVCASLAVNKNSILLRLLISFLQTLHESRMSLPMFSQAGIQFLLESTYSMIYRRYLRLAYCHSCCCLLKNRS